MLCSKCVIISVVENEFEDKKSGDKIAFKTLNVELDGGELLKDIKTVKGSTDGLARFDEVKGYFRYEQDGKIGKLVFTGYSR